MKRLKVFFLVILSATLFLGGCERETLSAEEMLCDICISLSMPVGQIYLSGSEEGSENFLTLDMADAMYGAEAEKVLSLVEDFAIYVSGVGAPREAAVFRCYSRSDTDTVAALCLERIDAINVLLKDSGAAELVSGAQVTLRGHYVVMLVTDDAEAAKDAVRSVFR